MDTVLLTFSMYAYFVISWHTKCSLSVIRAVSKSNKMKLFLNFNCSMLHFVFVFLFRITYNCLLHLHFVFDIFMYYSYCLQFNICGIEGQFNNPNHCCFKLTYNEFIFIISRIIFKNIPNRSWIFTVDSSLMIKINLQRTYFYLGIFIF